LIEISKDTAKRLPEYLITSKKLANELVEEYRRFWFAGTDEQRIHIKNFIEKDIGAKFQEINNIIFTVVLKYEQDQEWSFLKSIDIQNAKSILDKVFNLLDEHNILFVKELSKE
jgi:hypothetical protein